MEADEPIIEDEITEEPVTEEETDPVLEQMAANIADDLDRQNEPEPDPMDKLRWVYKDYATVNPLVEEVINGLTTFREALDEILLEMGSVGDEASLRDFVDCYTCMSTLLINPVLNDEERKDLYRFSHLHSVKAFKKFRKDQLIFGGCSGLAWIAGEYIVRQPRYVQLGLIVKAIGMGGVSGTVLVELKHQLRGNKLGKKASKTKDVLYTAADALDSEVKELFGRGWGRT